MSPYRAPTPRPQWFVEARVRGPLNSFLMGAVIEGWTEDDALDRFVADMTEAGFVILTAPRVSKSGAQ